MNAPQTCPQVGECCTLRHQAAVLAAGLVLAANCIIPLTMGDVYPFTTGPMFRDCPRQFCNYRIFDEMGNLLPSDHWLVQRVYDGNPIGYGVGVRPPQVLEQSFGVVHRREAIQEHVVAQLRRPEHRSIPMVEVVQEVIGPIDAQRVGPIKENRWKFSRE